MRKHTNSIKAQAVGDLIRRYKTIFTEVWSRRHELDSAPRLRHEYEFLPATLTLQETPAHPAPQIFMRSILVFVVLLLGWSIIGKLDVVASASGKIVPDSRSKVIQPLETAAVRAIYVTDGQTVKAGDKLIDLDATITQADSDRLSAEFESTRLDVAMYNALIQAQISEAREVIEGIVFDENPIRASLSDIKAAAITWQQNIATGQFKAYQTRMAQLAATVVRYEAEQRSVHATVETLQNTLPIIQQKEKDFHNLLAKNYVSQQEYLEQKKQLIEQRGSLNAALEKLAEISASRAEAEREREQFYAQIHSTWLDKLNEAKQKGIALEHELDKANSRGSFMQLKSPVDGAVQQLNIHTLGGVVTSAQHLMTIVPSDSPIEVEAFLANQDRGFVNQGQDVEVKVETFSFTKYGTIKGEVIAISSDAIKDDRLGLVFSVRVRLDRNTILVDGNHVLLSPGMAVTVEIKTMQRRVIEYFLDPLIKHSAESLRER